MYKFMIFHSPAIFSVRRCYLAEKNMELMRFLISTSSSSSSLISSFYGEKTWMLGFVLLFLWVVLHRLRQQGYKEGPKTWPVIGATIEQVLNYERMHDWILEYFFRSKTVVVPVLFSTYTYISDPANVEHVLKTNFSNYPKGEVYRSFMEVLLGNGIFNTDGELWRKQRKTASFEFASKNLRDFSTVVFREYSLKLSSIITNASFWNQKIDMQDLFMRMTLDSICKVGFGVEIGTLTPDLPQNSFAQAFDTANATVTRRFINPLWKPMKLLNIGSEARLVKSIKIIDDFTYSIIHKRKKEIKEAQNNHKQIKHDILSRFIELSEEVESDITDKSLRDIVLNFVIAGRDTTAVTLSWAVYMLVTHPSLADKLYSELKCFEEAHAQDEKILLHQSEASDEDAESFKQKVDIFAGMLTYDSLTRLRYLHAFITETLRLYPAVPQDPKGILKDDILPDGTRLKAGGLVTYVPYSMGRLEHNWGSDAASFKPERWLIDGNFQNASPFKFAAFQAGPRICLGKDSAYLQMKMALAIICRFFEFKLQPGHVVKYRLMAILAMENGLHVTVGRRH